ncbi:hypothetical protein LINPERHAP1_LOCUS28534, partial [Linum perenne]
MSPKVWFNTQTCMGSKYDPNTSPEYGSSMSPEYGSRIRSNF